jgi:DNA polymerase
VKQIVFDFETFYSKEYTLKQMTPVEYILDPRFEIIGCAVKEGNSKTFFLEEDDLVRYLAKLPEKVLAISHNALFDMGIMAWRLNYIPHLMVDTLGMARALLAKELRSLALKSVALHLGLGVKGDTVMKVIGMNKAAIRAAGLWDAYAAYSCTDADLEWGLYLWAIENGFPLSEIAVMDTVLRACIKPGFVLDRMALAEHLYAVQKDKEALLQVTGLGNRDALMSNDRFAMELEKLGVDPPRKISPVTGKENWAFAKTDPDFIELEEHEDPRVQALVAARLGIKSTIEETRTQRLIAISNVTWPSNIELPFPHQGYSPIPMPLKYSGAHTHRLGGDWKLNMQNMPARANNKIRKAIKSPPGYVVVAVDASQIECRMAADFCGALSLVAAFREKREVYAEFASDIFGYPVTKATHPVERFTGKTGILGLQYELGWPKFQRTVKLKSKQELGQEISLSDERSLKVVTGYRTKYFQIPAMWRTLNGLIAQMTMRDCDVTLGPVRFLYEEIRLPNGLSLYYHNLRYEDDGWRFSYAGVTKYIYGGKLLENIIQALARIVIMDAAVRFRKQTQIDLNLQVHDELVYVVPEMIGTVVQTMLVEQLSIAPEWMPDVPLAAEGGIGLTYGDAK